MLLCAPADGLGLSLPKCQRRLLVFTGFSLHVDVLSPYLLCLPSCLGLVLANSIRGERGIEAYVHRSKAPG